MTREYLITWADGREEVEKSEAADTNAYAMERWGVEGVDTVFALYGIKVSANDFDAAAAAKAAEEAAKETAKPKAKK